MQSDIKGQARPDRYGTRMDLIHRTAPNDPPAVHEYAEALPVGETGSLVHIAEVIWRSKNTLLSCIILGLIIGLVITFINPAIYPAEATLEFQNWNDNILKMASVGPSNGAEAGPIDLFIETQIQVIRSKLLLNRTKQKLERRPLPDRTTVSNTSFVDRLLHGRKSSGTRAQALTYAADNIKVSPVRGAKLIKIQSYATDPRLAADFANGLASEFINYDAEQFEKEAKGVASSLMKHVQEIRGNLERSEAALQSYARDKGLMFTEEKDNVGQERLLQLQAELSRAQAERITLQSKYELAASRPIETIPEIVDSVPLRESSARIAELRRQLADMSFLMTPNYYKVKQLQAQIAEQTGALEHERKNVLDRLRNDYDSAAKRERLLSEEHSKQQARLGDEARSAIGYGLLKREADTNRQLYDAMLQKYKESSITSAVRPENIRILDTADPAKRPEKPDVGLNLAVAVCASGFIGLTIVLIRERVDRSIRKPGESQAYFRVPELGAIPSFELVRSSNRHSLMAESFRAVVTSILFSRSDVSSAQAFVVTSPHAREGKTTAVTNLGLTLALASRRVLLIDGDLWKPRLHKVYNLPNEYGLSDLLSGPEMPSESTLNKSVRATEVPGLFVLPSGPGRDGSANALDTNRAAEILKIAKAHFDFVLIDTPPVMNVADGRVWGRLAGGAVVIFRAGETDRSAASATLSRLYEDGIEVIGSVLNDWDPRSRGSYAYEESRQPTQSWTGHLEASTKI
jgi:succinoglycan biosynthesis transport protein ExoP